MIPQARMTQFRPAYLQLPVILAGTTAFARSEFMGSGLFERIE